MFEAILSILTGTPWWVFVIFGYVLFIGLKATRPHTVPLMRLFILPIIFNIWSLVNFITSTYAPVFQLALWLGMLLLGLAIGYFIHSKRTIVVDHTAMTVHLPGSWIPLILIMSIFIVKYYFGYACSTASSQAECAAYRLYSSYFSAFASGILLGNVTHIAKNYYGKK